MHGVKLIFALCQVTTTLAAFRHIYYVQSTTKGGIILPSMRCPGIPCYPLTYYLQRSDQFFRSNSIFYFMSGIHLFQIDRRLIDNSVMISNIQNLDLIGSSYITRRPKSVESSRFTIVEPTTQLVCNPHTPAALAIINVANLKIANLAFSGCGRALRSGIWNRAMNDLQPPIFPPVDLRPPAAIFMSKIRTTDIENILVQNSTGYGLLGINILGNSHIHNLYNNNYAIGEGGNAFLVYVSTNECERKQSLRDLETEELSIDSTQFMFSVGRGFPSNFNSHYKINSFIGGGGLTIMTTTADFYVNVNIRDIVAAYNSVLFESDGINLWTIIHREANFLSVQITNLTSMHGKHLNATPFGGSKVLAAPL